MNGRALARLGLWGSITALVVVATRAVVYALAPRSVLLEALAKQEAGPRVAGALVAAVLAAAGLGAAVLWLASVAVRERLAVEGRRLVARPRLRAVRLSARLGGLFLVASFAFAMTESYIHWREGLGWHGLHCLTGPVHRDAIPILFALSVVAVAVHGAVEHLLAWARRAFAQLAARLPLLRGTATAVLYVRERRPCFSGSVAGARGPPAAAGPVSVPTF